MTDVWITHQGDHSMAAKHKYIVIPLFIVLILTTFRCHAEQVRIGLSLGLSGKYAPMASMQEKSFKLWAEQTNNSGGLLGRQIKLVIYDDESNKAKAQEIYRRLINEEQVDLLFPPYSSGLTASILPITEKHGYPLLASGASADSIWQKGYRYIFGVYSPASRYTLGFVEMVLANNLTRLAIISSDDSFSVNLANGTEKWASRLGLDVVQRETFTKGTDQLDPVAQRAKRSDAQVVIMCGHFDESVNMRNAMKNIGWYPKAYYASVGPVLQTYSDQLKETAEYTFSSTQWMFYDKLPFPGGKEFFKSFTDTYGVEPSYQAAAAYSAGVILASAVSKAGELDREKIRQSLITMDMMTLMGRYGVNRTGMQIRHFATIIQWLDNRQEVVWPQELSTATPLFK